MIMGATVGSISYYYEGVVTEKDSEIVSLQKTNETLLGENQSISDINEDLTIELSDTESELLNEKEKIKSIEEQLEDAKKSNAELKKKLDDADSKNKNNEKKEILADKEKPVAKEVVSEKSVESNDGWTEMTVNASAYTMVANGDEMGGTGLTSTGKVPTAYHTIAVDPSVIPYGSLIQYDGVTYVAEDTGGMINGYKVDIYKDTLAECEAFGRKDIKILVKPA